MVIRDRLRAILDERGRSARDVSLSAGLASTAVRDILNGKSRSPGYATLTVIAQELGCSVDDFVDTAQVAETRLPPSRVAPRYLPVRYKVQAGAWVEIDADEAPVQVSVAVVPHPRYTAWPQWLELVVGDSANLKILPGHYVHVVDAIDMGYAPVNGDWVVVERRRAGTRERTIKQIEIDASGQVLLRPRSSNPRWQDPIKLTDGAREGEEIEVEIVGKVIGAYDPEF